MKIKPISGLLSKNLLKIQIGFKRQGFFYGFFSKPQQADAI
jgi:hypothetical protein